MQCLRILSSAWELIARNVVSATILPRIANQQQSPPWETWKRNPHISEDALIYTLHFSGGCNVCWTEGRVQQNRIQIGCGATVYILPKRLTPAVQFQPILGKPGVLGNAIVKTSENKLANRLKILQDLLHLYGLNKSDKDCPYEIAIYETDMVSSCAQKIKI